MNYKDKMLLYKIIEPAYKQLMVPLYKQFKEYDSVEVRLETVRWINDHNHRKLVEQYSKRKYRRKRERRLKTELGLLKVQNEIKNFEENL